MCWQIVTNGQEPGPDWRAHLAARPGISLRRIGTFAELSLHGALSCMDAATASGQSPLPPHALLRLCSRSGATQALSDLMQQHCVGLPMPFTFLQSQPSQTLAVLSRHLDWQGDASFHVHADPLAVLRLALLEAGPWPLLFGCVDEQPAVTTRWYYLLPRQPVDAAWHILAAGELPPENAKLLGLRESCLHWAA